MRKRKEMRKRIAAFMAIAMIFSAGNNVCAAEQEENVFAGKMEQMYAEPEMRYRPYARWWLAEGSHTDATLRESIQELYEAGYGGVEFVTLNESKYLDNENYAWGSPEWLHDTRIIIEECSRLGMSVSMTSGTHWATANLISITPNEEAASQELGYTVLHVEESQDGSTRYDGYLPYCALPNESVTKQTLVKVIAAKAEEQDGIIRLDMKSMSDVTDLTEQSEGGAYGIHFQAEDEGEYELFAFYQYGTGESYSPAISPSYTINYLDKAGAEALIDYWDKNVLTDEVQEVVDQIEECALYMDSLELSVHGSNTTGQLWCEDMEKEFAVRMEYGIDEYLPFLILENGRSGCFGEPLSYVYEPMDEEDMKYVENLRRDFCQVQTEMYTENCLEVLQDWLHSKNMKLRAENSYGMRFEISQPVTALDYVETESMEFANEIDSYRGMAGAAHLLNKRMSSETGAWVSGNYVYDHEYYRQIFYMQYASGIQKTVIHGYSSEYGPEERVKWPGYEGMSDEWSERFNKRQPAAADYTEVNLHLSRLQKVLEQGTPKMDLAILRTDYAYNNQLTPGGLIQFVEEGVYSNKAHNQDAYYWRDMELQNAGYTYDYFSPYLLTNEGVSSSDGLLNADGVAYQALLLMEDELPLEAAARILEWAKEGLPIVFVNHVSELVANENVEKINSIAAQTTGSNRGDDKELAEIVEAIKSMESVRTVDSQEDAYEALKELGVSPRAEYKEANTKLLSAIRSTEEADYLYLYDYMYEDTENYKGQIVLDGIRKVYVLDTWSGEVMPAPGVSYEDDNTVLDVDIAPGETMVFVLQKGETDNLKETDADEETELMELDGWSLVVDSYEPGEKISRTEENPETGITTTEVAYTTSHVEMDAGILEQLIPWKDLKSIGEEVSGVGTYTLAFELPVEWVSNSSRIEFRAESFEGGTASVWVNGEKVPVNMDRCTADVTDFVKEGENTIKIRVTSSLRNVMIRQGYESGWIFGTPQPDDYGMTGKTKLYRHTA